MKKFIGIIVAISLIFALSACTKNDDSVKPSDVETTIGTEATEIIEETEEPTTNEIDISKFPDADEYDEFEWPSFGVTENIPVPTWSNRGEVYFDTSETFCGEVGYTTLDDYNSYVKQCQADGYVENYYSAPGYLYYAENADGCAVLLMYDDSGEYMQIQVTTNPESWSRPWME